MIAKLTLTTACGAKCITCPNWQHEKKHMPFNNFVTIWNKIIEEQRIHKVILNNVGDLYYHPDCVKILKYINRNRREDLWITLITNGSKMSFIPNIHELIVSFNGGDKESYEKITGLSFQQVTYNIKYKYADIKKNADQAELNILIFEENKDSEENIKNIWNDFPGKVRISYKYDNQGGKDLTLGKYKQKKRIFCNYLDIINIDWNGDIVMCAHDWQRENVWGNFLTDDYDRIVRNKERLEKIKEQGREEFLGICEKCNFNVKENVKYV